MKTESTVFTAVANYLEDVTRALESVDRMERSLTAQLDQQHAARVRLEAQQGELLDWIAQHPAEKS